jgi:hypothetical protein
MLNSIRKYMQALLAVTGVVASQMVLSPAAMAQQSPTGLQLMNNTKHSVQVFVNVPPSSNLGCGPTQISQLTATSALKGRETISQAGGSNTNGVFILLAKDTVTMGLQQGNGSSVPTCFDTVGFTFGAQAQCPCLARAHAPFGACGLPHGVNLPEGTNTAEVVLNPPLNNENESVDISCINGANSQIQFSLPGSQWTSNGSNTINSIANSVVILNPAGVCINDGNCNLNGVYPYNLTNCTSGPGNACGGLSQAAFCTESNAICQVQRPAGVTGGTVTIIFQGLYGQPL